MTDQDVWVERADYLSDRRARMFPMLAVIFLAQQATYLIDAATARGRSTTSRSRPGSSCRWCCSRRFATNGFWLQPREVRDLHR